MRISHCTVALALVLLLAGAGFGQAPAADRSEDFTLFFRGIAVGAEEVTVTRTPDGILISGTSRSGPPLNVVARRAEIRYTPDWRPVECVIEGSVNDLQVGISTRVTGTSVSTLLVQGTSQSEKIVQVPDQTLILPTMLYTATEALAARLSGSKPGGRFDALSPPEAAIAITVRSVSDDRVRTQTALLQIRRYALDFTAQGKTTSVELWADADGRLLRFALPAQGFDVVRRDVASVSSRREPVARPNDEQIHIPANGFSLAGTLSKPAAAPPKGTRLPAIVLVTGSSSTDRDESVAGIPIMGEIASALADAGYVVVRYDKRGVGQSGGRSETVTLEDYAEDAIAAVRFLDRRKDVDPKRIAMVGYGEGGAVAAAAASRADQIAALVLMAAPGVSGAELVLDQQRQLLAEMGIPEAERLAKLQLQQAIQQAVISGTWPESIPAELRRQADTPWYRSYLLFDPEKAIRKTGAPLLIVHGDLDRQIPPANADRLAAAAAARKGRAGQAVKVLKLAGINHLLVPAKTGGIDEYERLTDRKVSPEVVSAITAWLPTVLRAR